MSEKLSDIHISKLKLLTFFEEISIELRQSSRHSILL